MEKEELLLIHGTEYKEMTREILYAAGLEAQIGARDKKIGIKPNLVAPSEAFLGQQLILKLWLESSNICRKRDFRISSCWKVPG